MRRINKEEFLREVEKLIMRIEAATVVQLIPPYVFEDSDGTPILIKSFADAEMIKDPRIRHAAELRARGVSEHHLIDVYGYRDEAASELRNQAWASAAYKLEQAAFHEEEVDGRPYPITFLPLLEELEDLLYNIGINYTRSIMFNMINK